MNDEPPCIQVDGEPRSDSMVGEAFGHGKSFIFR